MFKFFTQKIGFYGVWMVQFLFLFLLGIQVQIDVKINEWFGEFYDTLQKALTTPNSITIMNLLVIFLHLQKLQLFGLLLLFLQVFLQVIGFLDGEHQWLIIIMSNG